MRPLLSRNFQRSDVDRTEPSPGNQTPPPSPPLQNVQAWSGWSPLAVASTASSPPPTGNPPLLFLRGAGGARGGGGAGGVEMQEPAPAPAPAPAPGPAPAPDPAPVLPPPAESNGRERPRAGFRTVRVRKSATDADSRPAGLFGRARRPPVGVAGNAVQTTKYLHNPVTALPKQLFWQFRRVFNIFWLFQCVIVLVPGLAPYASYTTLSGFGFVLAVTLAKDFYEDYQRLKADRHANAQPVEVLRDGAFRRISAWELLVGDIVRVTDGEQFPVDMVVLTSSDPTGLCLVETSNLDGERNLKRYFALGATRALRYASMSYVSLAIV